MAHLIDTVFIRDRNEEITRNRIANGTTGTDSWHEVGRPIDWNADITADMIPDLAGWNFEYDLIQGHYQDHNGVWQPMDKMAVVRRDTRVRIGDVGKGFTKLPFDHAINILRPWVDSKLATPHTGGLLDEGRVSFLTLEPKDVDPIEIVKGDPTKLYICFVQGHVGNLAATLGMTHVRMVCWNTVSAGLRDGKAKVSCKHTKNVGKGIQLAARTLDIAKAEFVGNAEQMAAMARFGVNAKDLEKFFRVVANVDQDKPYSELPTKSKNLLGKLYEALETAPGATVASGTLYAAYQAATYYNTHVKGHAKATDAAGLAKRAQSLWTGPLGKANGVAWATAIEWMNRGTLVAPANNAA
jgi:phage/plasmid-like protein (TIGR03299 family)